VGLHVVNRVHEAIGLFARSLEQEKGEPLGALRPDPGQALQLLDKPDERIG